jgi:endonuclease/exonuclease/phosphatase family metal-dependent hydrolase
VLKVVADVPTIRELHFYCTHLDHLNEEWRMKQVMAMMSRDDAAHVLAGSLNSLDTADYMQERWENMLL